MFSHSWYVPDYSYGAPLQWGHGMGCGFLNSSCYRWVVSDSNTSLTSLTSPGTAQFCHQELEGRERCVEQRRAVGVCRILDYQIPIEPDYQVTLLCSR